jgi:hypothetical protein
MYSQMTQVYCLLETYEFFFLSVQCHFISVLQSSDSWISHKFIFYNTQKQHHSMPHVVPVRPQSRYPRAPRETGSTLFQPQLHLLIGRYTSVYIRKPSG